MKIAFTISDAEHYLNVGGEIERKTHIVDLPDHCLPPGVRQFLIEMKKPKPPYLSMSVSIIEEGKE